MVEELERDVESYARELVSLQRRLISLLARTFDWTPAGESLSLGELPRYGTLEEPDTIWGFSQHGTGIRFINIRNLACVDIENHLEDGEVFTLWRLQVFMESVGGDDSLVTLLTTDGHAILEHFATRAIGTSDGYRLRQPKPFSPDRSIE